MFCILFLKQYFTVKWHSLYDQLDWPNKVLFTKSTLLIKIKLLMVNSYDIFFETRIKKIKGKLISAKIHVNVIFIKSNENTSETLLKQIPLRSNRPTHWSLHSTICQWKTSNILLTKIMLRKWKLIDYSSNYSKRSISTLFQVVSLLK